MAPALSRSFGTSSVAALHFFPSSSSSCPLASAHRTASLVRSGASISSATSGLRWNVERRESRMLPRLEVNRLMYLVSHSVYFRKEAFRRELVKDCSCLKEKGYVMLHNFVTRCCLSVGASSSRGQEELKLDDAEIKKDKFLIDCGPEQECVIGGIVALGKFDALHIGHRELAIQASKAGTPFLLSFVGIAEVLGWEHRAPIVAKSDRQRVLSSWTPFCNNVTPLEFQVEFSKVRHLSPQQFVERLSKELKVSGVVAGENYRFGYRASGDASELVRLCKEYGLDAYILSAVIDNKTNNQSKKEMVSSTRVRQALSVGDMGYVAELLGRKHRLMLTVNEGCVFTGNKITIPRSCMLNQAPTEGLYESCSLLLDDMLVGPCRFVIDTRHIHVELDSMGACGCEPIRDSQLIGIDFS